MSCSENTNPCTCGNNACGCKISSDDVAYQGPNLECTGINTCDTLTEAIQKIDEFGCSEELVNIIIYNIQNNVDLYQQFTTIVNQTVDCQTVFDCLATSTTTTTTTLCPCTTYRILGPLTGTGTFTYVECNTLDLQTVLMNDIAKFVCVDNNYPTIKIGIGNILNEETCCP